MHQVVAATAGQAHQLAVTAVLAQQVRVYGTPLQVTHDLHILAATATVPDIHDSLLPAATAVDFVGRHLLFKQQYNDYNLLPYFDILQKPELKNLRGRVGET